MSARAAPATSQSNDHAPASGGTHDTLSAASANAANAHGMRLPKPVSSEARVLPVSASTAPAVK